MRTFALSCLAASTLCLSGCGGLIASLHQSAVVNSKMDAQLEKTGKPICAVTFSLGIAGGSRKSYTEWFSPNWYAKRPYRLCERLQPNDTVPVTLSETKPRILWELFPYIDH